jgi:ABC-2 type transport system permease protein
VTTATSTLTDRRAAFRPSKVGDVLRSEWTKLWSVRSTFWALGLAVALGVGLGAAISAAASHAYATDSLSDRLKWDPTSISLSGQAIAQLAIAVLGVLLFSSEYASGMIRTTFTAVPKRGRVLVSKCLVYAVTVFVLGEATSFIAFFLGQAIIKGHAPHASLGQPGVLRAVIGAGLYLTVLAVLGIAVGTLLRHSAAAIAAIVAVLFVLPGIAQALPDSWRHPVTEYWPTQAGSQITAVHQDMYQLQPWAGFGLMCGFVAVVFLLSLLLLERRDA